MKDSMNISICAFGEPMAEFSHYGGNRYYLSYSGDSVNLSTSVARLGLRPAVISAVGDDHFGRGFIGFASSEGISTEGIQVEKGGFTGLYFIDVGREGEHEFTYFRKGSSASSMKLDSRQRCVIRKSAVFHFSGIAQAISSLSRRECARACSVAADGGCFVSYDVNFRPKLWGRDEALDALEEVSGNIDLLLVSSEDHELLFGREEPNEAVKRYMRMGIENIIYKAGKFGSAGYFGKRKIYQTAYSVEVVDTTGAGDAYDAGFLCSQLMGMSFSESLRMASVNAALKCRKKGGTRGLPSLNVLRKAMGAMAK